MTSRPERRRQEREVRKERETPPSKLPTQPERDHALIQSFLAFQLRRLKMK